MPHVSAYDDPDLEPSQQVPDLDLGLDTSHLLGDGYHMMPGYEDLDVFYIDQEKHEVRTT